MSSISCGFGRNRYGLTRNSSAVDNSSPASRTKKEGHDPRSCPSFLGFAAQRAAPPFGIGHARAKWIRPAQFSAAPGGCEFTAQERRGPEGPLGSILVNSPKAENINFNRHCHAGVKFALLRRLLMPYGKKPSSARFLAPPLQTETAQEHKMELGERRYKAPAFTAEAAGSLVSSKRDRRTLCVRLSLCLVE